MTFRRPAEPGLVQPSPRLNPAEWFQERLEKEITETQDALPEGQVLDVTVILRDGSKVKATWFGFWRPDMMRVEGVDEQGREVKVVMHYAALEVVIRTVDAAPGDVKKPRIGFQAPES